MNDETSKIEGIVISDALFEKLAAVAGASDIESLISSSGVSLEIFQEFLSQFSLSDNISALQILGLLQTAQQQQAKHRNSEDVPDLAVRESSEEQKPLKSNIITPVLMCDFAYSQLWPLSRKSYPKQFVDLLGGETLFQASARHLSGPGFSAPVVVTDSDLRFTVAGQLAAAGIQPEAILIEPEARNNAPAVLAAALHVAARDPEALMLVAPSDHVMSDAAEFRAAVEAGAEAAHAGQIVAFGIRPTRPETGFSWLELAAPPEDGRAVVLSRLVPKPDAKRAAEMLDAGNYLWSAGVLLFSAKTILEAFASHAPRIGPPVTDAIENAQTDMGFIRLDPVAWSGIEDISIDLAIMQRAGNLSAVSYGGGWTDLGDWAAVWAEMGPDGAGNSLAGPVTAVDCEGSLLRSESDGLELVGIGLKDVIAVAMPDAVLVADRSRAQDVDKAVAKLRAKGAKQAATFPLNQRSWGYFETLALNERLEVNRIVVRPGAALRLQLHNHRSKHWIVIQGAAKVTVGDTVMLVTENQSVHIPPGTVHRMENPGTQPIMLIEVETGIDLGEDKIDIDKDVYIRN